MNIYKTSFRAECPSDGEMVDYQFEMKTERMVMVENILEAFPKGPCYHEDAADKLKNSLGGEQRITALHQGVEITTIR